MPVQRLGSPQAVLWGEMPKLHKPKLGQNFLVDEEARRRIVDALGNVSSRTVVEIGPGHGAITEILAARCGRLVALELDHSLAAELSFRFRGRDNVTIVQGDVLAADFAQLAGGAETIDVIGNLPYYITSDILLQLFAAAEAGVVRRAVLMLQREVADRVAAGPGGSEYGLLSATAQMFAQVQHLFTLPPSAFQPPPEVYSSVIRLEFAPRFAELGVDREGFIRFLRQAFAQKRKTLGKNLRNAGYSAEALECAWPQGLELQARAEQVAGEVMAALYRELKRPCEPT